MTFSLFKKNPFNLDENKLFDLLKNRWVLIVILIVFTVFKIPHLICPFYCDESWPYVPAIKMMYKHGISLLPGAIDPIYSRGHPLFFHAAGAVWMHVFGSSNTSLHCFAFFISVLFLVTVYEVGYRLFNQRVAIISLLLVAGHVSFFVQSSFVLLEVLLAFLGFLSIYLYVKEKYGLATIALICLFFTKESGVIVGFVIGVDAFIGLFNNKAPLKTRLLKFVPTSTACLLLGVFFIIQRHTRGWYVFPLHTETILQYWSDIWYRFRTCTLRITFNQGYEYVILITLLVFSMVLAFKERKKNNLLLLLLFIPIIIAYYIVDDCRYETLLHIIPVSSGWLFLIFIISYFAALWAYSNSKFYLNKQQVRFISLLGAFIICFIFYSSFAFFTARYLLMCSIPALFLMAVFFDMLIRQTYKLLYYVLLIIIGVTTYYSFKNSTAIGDCNLGFMNGLKVQTDVVKYMEDNNLYEKNISSGSYLTVDHLVAPGTGFLRSGKVFKHVKYEITDSTEFVIFDNIISDRRYDSISKDTSYTLIYSIKDKLAWAEIYRKNITK